VPIWTCFGGEEDAFRGSAEFLLEVSFLAEFLRIDFTGLLGTGDLDRDGDLDGSLGGGSGNGAVGGADIGGSMKESFEADFAFLVSASVSRRSFLWPTVGGALFGGNSALDP
jgi:hypothetical protein